MGNLLNELVAKPAVRNGKEREWWQIIKNRFENGRRANAGSIYKTPIAIKKSAIPDIATDQIKRGLAISLVSSNEDTSSDEDEDIVQPSRKRQRYSGNAEEGENEVEEEVEEVEDVEPAARPATAAAEAVRVRCVNVDPSTNPAPGIPLEWLQPGSVVCCLMPQPRPICSHSYSLPSYSTRPLHTTALALTRADTPCSGGAAVDGAVAVAQHVEHDHGGHCGRVRLAAGLRLCLS